jgi:uncharacterized membrane protein YfcA
LGIGGGIVLIPCSCTSRRSSVASLDIRHVAGITIVQVCASLLGFLNHHRRRTTNPRVVH